MYVALFIFLVLTLLILPVWWWRGAPFVPTDPAKIKRIMYLARVRPGESACDLGSGDGRLVIACAKAGAKVAGYELNPLLVWWSRYLIQRAGVGDSATVRRSNYWNEDLSSFDIVLVFGTGGPMMVELERKLRAELKAGARIVSNGFELPNWPIKQRDRSLYLYTKEQVGM